MRSPTTYGLAALLLASLALNVRFWTTRGAPGATPPRASATATARDEPGACERRLQACEQRSWAIARRALAAEVAPKPEATAAPAAAPKEPLTQASALCSKAEQHLRESWQRDKDKIVWGLSQYLSNRDEQERSIARDVAKMKEVTGLDDREAAEVARAYHDRRLSQVAEAQAALAKDPQDFPALLDSARTLLADEDALLERVGGPGARDAWRADQVETRTVIMALVASLADKDWDESIRW
jgi:hypothetical protein